MEVFFCCCLQSPRSMDCDYNTLPMRAGVALELVPFQNIFDCALEWLMDERSLKTTPI